MGIRMLHRRPASSTPPPPVPAFAAGASTARLAIGPAEALRHTAKDLRSRCTPVKATREPVPARPGDPPVWRLWADLARGHLTLLIAHLPRTRPPHTLTVFTAPTPAGAHGKGTPNTPQ
ncbi:hypothetical protein ACIQAC_00795 [Streptomyces sp. NPDC088387]|uniref:hypothetical protein n=1 Tax=Streptomyces sp. NPDC088387 TaxID=3365859 RepID=UPI0038205C31